MSWFQKLALKQDYYYHITDALPEDLREKGLQTEGLAETDEGEEVACVSLFDDIDPGADGRIILGDTTWDVSGFSTLLRIPAKVVQSLGARDYSFYTVVCKPIPPEAIEYIDIDEIKAHGLDPDEAAVIASANWRRLSSVPLPEKGEPVDVGPSLEEVQEAIEGRLSEERVRLRDEGGNEAEYARILSLKRQLEDEFITPLEALQQL